MGGISLGEDFDWVEEVAAAPITMVLMGRTGNGKSATGNSILGFPAFKSRGRASSVTTTCELQSTVRSDGRKIRVVDTPGFFEVSMPAETVRNEIVKCLELAKDGVHALLLVLSVRNRFTLEEMNVVDNLRCLFGNKVLQYMIVVFTGGDELEEDGSLDEYCADAPEHLKSLLNDCGGRKILFNNRSKDEKQKQDQTTALLRAVDDMVVRNGGKPYTNELFGEAQILAKQSARDKRQLDAVADRRQEMELLKHELEQAHEEKWKAMVAMVDEKLRLTAEFLEQKLAEEKRAREFSERQALQYKELSERQAAESEMSIKQMKLQLDKALKESEELRKETERAREAGFCTIL